MLSERRKQICLLQFCRLARHSARSLNLDDHIDQEAHDVPWFGARGSNTGPGFAFPGGASLCHSCYGGVSRKKLPLYMDLTTKLLRTNAATVGSPVRTGNCFWAVFDTLWSIQVAFVVGEPVCDLEPPA